jgi:hypothetical protein
MLWQHVAWFLAKPLVGYKIASQSSQLAPSIASESPRRSDRWLSSFGANVLCSLEPGPQSSARGKPTLEFCATALPLPPWVVRINRAVQNLPTQRLATMVFSFFALIVRRTDFPYCLA